MAVSSLGSRVQPRSGWAAVGRRRARPTLQRGNRRPARCRSAHSGGAPRHCRPGRHQTIVAPEGAPGGVAMTIRATDGPVMIRAFMSHEHGELATGIDGIHELAIALGVLPAREAARGVGEVLRWVNRPLKPHLAWEEAWLFPQLDARA